MATITEMKPKKIRIGDLLIANKVISQEQLTAALADQKKSGRKLGRVLIENGYLSEDQLLDFLARQLNISNIDLKRYALKPETVRLIPEVHARRFRVLALEEARDGLLIGMADPTDIFAYDELTRVLRRPLRLAVVREADLLKTIDLMYRRTAEISGLAQELTQELSENDVDLGALAANEALTDAPVVKLLQSIFEDAVQVNASDIHIEPDERELRIRFRQDGVLRVQTVAERRITPALISRLKLMAGLDISEKRLPQDGRFNVRVRDKSIDVRLSTLPTQYGESAVMRLLNQSGGVLDLEQLGMPGDLLGRFRRLIQSPHGMVLVTGPTGSGKTTTLYAALKELNQPAHKIITVEDPVEYRLPGITQVQVNAKIDLTFARVLRTVLRQDPDIVLVGEMRDQETAEQGRHLGRVRQQMRLGHRRRRHARPAGAVHLAPARALLGVARQVVDKAVVEIQVEHARRTSMVRMANHMRPGGRKSRLGAGFRAICPCCWWGWRGIRPKAACDADSRRDPLRQSGPRAHRMPRQRGESGVLRVLPD